MAEGEFALVQKYLELAINKTAAWVGEHDLYAMLADVAAQQRDQASLQKYAPLAEEFASRYEHKLYQAVAHRAWGVAYRLTGQHAEAGLRLNQALEIFQHMGTRWQVGRTYVELGELAIAQTNLSIAHDYLSRAIKLFDEIQAIPDLTRTQSALQGLM